MKLPKADQHKIYKCVGELVGLIKSQYPDLALRLYLQAAEAINRIPNYHELEEEAYDFCTNSLLIYEEELSDSEAKFAAINLIVSTTFGLTCFGQENYDTLVTNTVSYCSKLLKKPSQCEAITFASSLYYSVFKKQGNKVMDCLKRAIKIADICQNQSKNLYLFAIILNKYLYYYSIEAEFITAEDVNNLIDLIKETVEHIEGGAEDQVKDALKYLANTKAAVKLKQVENARYAEINVSNL